jgi:hypothetical protein
MVAHHSDAHTVNNTTSDDYISLSTPVPNRRDKDMYNMSDSSFIIWIPAQDVCHQPALHASYNHARPMSMSVVNR